MVIAKNDIEEVTELFKGLKAEIICLKNKLCGMKN